MQCLLIKSLVVLVVRGRGRGTLVGGSFFQDLDVDFSHFFGDVFVFHQEGSGWVFAVVGGLKLVCFLVVIVGFEVHLFLVADDLVLHSLGHEQIKSRVLGRDNQGNDVERLDLDSSLGVNVEVPEEVAEGEEEESDLEDGEDVLAEGVPEVDGGGPPEEIVLFDPVLHDEDAHCDGSGQGDDETVEGNSENDNDVEGIALSNLKFGHLVLFVQLNLNCFEALFVRCVVLCSPVLKPSIDVARPEDTGRDVCESGDDDHRDDLVGQTVLAQGIDGLDEVEDQVNEGGVDCLGHDHLGYQ